MKIYTKTGDKGSTGLWGGQRVSKNSLRVEAYGSVDELNAVIGLARAHGLPADLDELLSCVQSELFVLGSDLASPGESERIPRINNDQVMRLEHEIDQFENELPQMRNFILPGGTLAAAHLHHARTVCRRAERHIVTLTQTEAINPQIPPYVNRLSDWLFVLARLANTRAGVEDVPWINPNAE